MQETLERQTGKPTAVLHVAPSPHVVGGALTTRRMMFDVLLGLTPAFLIALYVFHVYAVKQVAVCVVSCLAAEGIFTLMRVRRMRLSDGSAAVTGVILAFSLPATAPWFVGAIGSFVGIGLGKVIFGGLGQNIFNPAMLGRAFVMVAFPSMMAASGYIAKAPAPDAMTHATPMAVAKEVAKKRADAAAPGLTSQEREQRRAAAQRSQEQIPSLLRLFIGTTNGSIGEVSALACLLGGLYLCLRRTASWEIPAGVLLAATAIAAAVNLANPSAPWGILHHLLGGALLFGAFFIATDPVTSPLTPKGKFLFGLGIGGLIMMMRLLSGYPEGVMFSVLIMNAFTPLLNRWTIPRPVGGPMAPPKPKPQE